MLFLNMITIVFSPAWFYGIDIFIDIISIIVLCLVAFFSFRYYLLDKKNWNYCLLSISFLMIAASFFFKIMTNFTLYYDMPKTIEVGFMNVTLQTVQQSDVFFTIGTYLFRLATLFGLLLLLNITKRQTWHSNILISALLILIMYFAQNAYHIFHITCFIFLVFITSNYAFKYLENKHKTTLLLCFSFGLLTIGHIIFYMMIFGTTFYVFAEIIQLLGYILLLITFVMVLYFGKKDTSKLMIKKPNYEIFRHPKGSGHGKKTNKA